MLYCKKDTGGFYGNDQFVHQDRHRNEKTGVGAVQQPRQEPVDGVQHRREAGTPRARHPLRHYGRRFRGGRLFRASGGPEDRAEPENQRLHGRRRGAPGAQIMKYTIKWTSRFKKEYKLLMKRGKDIQALDNVIRLLADGVKLPPECRDHVLSGRYAGLHECHVRPDLLLVYDIDEGVLVLTLFRTGSHSDLF